MNTITIVQKLWNYCNVLRDGSKSYSGYVENIWEILREWVNQKKDQYEPTNQVSNKR